MITNLTVLIVSGCVWAKSLCCTPYRFRSVQSLSCAWLSTTHGLQQPGLPVHHWLPELAQTHVHSVSDAIQQSHPLSPTSPPAFNLPQHQGLLQWVKLFASGGQRTGVSASALVLPMNIQDQFPLGLTSWSLQGTVKSLLQHRSSKASILPRSAFFTVQLSHPYMTTGKTLAFTRQTLLAK